MTSASTSGTITSLQGITSSNGAIASIAPFCVGATNQAGRRRSKSNIPRQEETQCLPFCFSP
jgi:hypothetical protein